MVFATLDIEQKLWENGYYYICGIDEVGRGCFAGPVFTGAVIFPKNASIPKGIADSKLLTAKKREQLAKEIKQIALSWSVANIPVSVINRVGIGLATQIGFRKSLKLLSVSVDFILIDAFYIKHLNRKRQRAIVGGDKLSASIAAASIIAKVERDHFMEDLHDTYPDYNFAQNKGYGTADHRAAIKKYGLTRLHRQSFDLKKFL